MKNDDALDALIATAKQHDVPPEGAEDRAWVGFVGALGGGGGGGGEASTPAADLAGAATNASAVAKGVAAFVVAAAAVVGVVRWAQPEPDMPVDPASAPAVVAPEAEPPAPAPPASAPPPSTPRGAASPPLAPDPVARPRPIRPSREREAPATGSASTLAEEARLVGAIWKAIDRGDADAALSLVARYRRDFEDGKLGSEARAAALVARCSLGKPINLTELDALRSSASPAVAKRLMSACERKR